MAAAASEPIPSECRSGSTRRQVGPHRLGRAASREELRSGGAGNRLIHKNSGGKLRR